MAGTSLITLSVVGGVLFTRTGFTHRKEHRMADTAIRCPACGNLHASQWEVDECVDFSELRAQGYGRCLNCEGQEPLEVLKQLEGFCSSECERDARG